MQNLYSLLSNSTYRSALFDITTTHIEVLVVKGHKVLPALLVEIGRLVCEPFLNALLELVGAVEPLTNKKSFQVQEEIKVARRHVGTVGEGNPSVPI